MQATLTHFCSWLGGTIISQVINDISWIIPAIQTIHIAGIAVLMGSMLMLDLRILNLAGTKQAMSGYAGRFLPWIWYTLPVLLLTGVVMIISDPTRELMNRAFQTKMGLVIAAIVVTIIFDRGIGKAPNYWESSNGRASIAKILAIGSILLWCCIVFAGRWIAYIK